MKRTHTEERTHEMEKIYKGVRESTQSGKNKEGKTEARGRP